MTATDVRLYELAEMRAVLEEWLAETEGEVTPELEALLDGLAGEVKEKVERVALYVREQLATAAAIDEEAKRLAARVAAKKRAAEGLKGYLKSQMERLGLGKVEGLLCTVAIQKNSAPAVRTILEAHELYAIAEAQPFVKRAEIVTYTLDRDAVLAAWKGSQPLPAAIAVDLGSHVRIR